MIPMDKVTHIVAYDTLDINYGKLKESTHLKFVIAKDAHDAAYIVNEELQLINTEGLSEETIRDMIPRLKTYRAYKLDENTKWVALVRRIPQLVITDCLGSKPKCPQCFNETTANLQKYCMNCGQNLYYHK